MKKALKILSLAALLSFHFMGNVDAKTRVPANYQPAEFATVVSDFEAMEQTRNRESKLGVKPMRMDAATSAVASYLGMDDEGLFPGGRRLRFNAEDYEILRLAPNVCESCTIVKVTEDMGTHVTNVGTYAVGQFSGYLFEYDVANDKWKSIQSTSPAKHNIFKRAQEKGASAIIYDCDEYEAWANNPKEEVDLTSYGTGKNHFSTPGAEDILIFAVQDNIKVNYTSGCWDPEQNAFAPQSTFYTTNLKKGECVRVWFYGPETLPNQAIVVESMFGKTAYPLTYNGKGGRRNPGYVK